MPLFGHDFSIVFFQLAITFASLHKQWLRSVSQRFLDLLSICCKISSVSFHLLTLDSSMHSYISCLSGRVRNMN